MATIPAEKIAEVRDRIEIDRVVGRSVKLTRKGNSLMGCCPFHSEKTPSFSVDPIKKLYHCFGCGVGGDVFDFVMRLDAVEFPEAVRLLAKEFGVELPEREESREEKRSRTERERMYRVNEIACAHYEARLARDDRAIAYLRETRGLTPKTIKTFNLGFAKDSWDDLARVLKDRKVPVEIPIRTGLVGKRQRGDGVYDRLRGKVVFPIRRASGEIAGFGARRADWIGDEDGPKYLNSIDSPIYDKSSVLYGIDVSKNPIRKQGRALLVEGYFDVIALHQAGVEGAVACCGTALSPRHATRLAKLTKNVVTLYDGDRAGVAATRRASETLLSAGVNVKVVALAGDDDPDTFVRREGKDALASLIDRAPSAIDFFLEKAIAEHEGAGVAGLVEIVHAIKPLLLAVQSEDQAALYAEGIARRLRIDPRQMWRQIRSKNTPSRGAARGRPQRGPDEPPPPDDRFAPSIEGARPGAHESVRREPVPVREMAVLRALIVRPAETLTELETRNALDALSHGAVRAAVDAALAARAERGPFDTHRALDAVRAAGFAAEVADLRQNLMRELPQEDDLSECVQRILQKHQKRQLSALKQRIAQETDPETKQKLIAELASPAIRDRALLH